MAVYSSGPHKAENFFANSVTTSFLRRAPVPRIFFMVRQPLVEHGLLNDEASRSHKVLLLWKSDRPVAETSICRHTTLTTDIYATDGIRTINPSK